MFGLAAFAAAMAGCQQEAPQTWMSATAQYDGRYQFGTNAVTIDIEVPLAEQPTLFVELYNTAANLPNQIWIDAGKIISDDYGVYPLKAKFDLTGSPAGFSAPAAENTKSAYYVIDNSNNPISPTSPAAVALITADGQERQGYREYNRATLVEGKIIKGAATTIGGNTGVDSIYLKFTLHSDFVTCESYIVSQKPDGTYVYAWRIKDGTTTPDPDTDEEWVLAGHRWTGYAEDLTAQ